MNAHFDQRHSIFLDAAVTAARAAGAVLLEELHRERRIEYKGTINLVTDADRRSEQTIVSSLRSLFPDHQVLAEEGTTVDGSSDYCWIIDPLDGTTNYAHRYPHFAVSIGLESQGEILVGAVYDPVRDEMFTARVGGGAFLNGVPLQVSNTEIDHPWPDMYRLPLRSQRVRSQLETLGPVRPLCPGGTQRRIRRAGPLLRRRGEVRWLLGKPSTRMGRCRWDADPRGSWGPRYRFLW